MNILNLNSKYMTKIESSYQPNFVDNRMIAKRFYFVELENYDSDSGVYNINFGKYAHVEKNVIMWHQSKDNDELFSKFHKSDFDGILKMKKIVKKE